MWLRPAAAEYCRGRIAVLTPASAAAFEALLSTALDTETRLAAFSGGVGGGGTAAESAPPPAASPCPHRCLSLLRHPYRAAWVRETAIALHEGRTLAGRVRAPPTRKQMAADPTAAAGQDGGAPAADGIYDFSYLSWEAEDDAHLQLQLPRRKLQEQPPPHTAVWRLAMAQLLRHCAEKAEWDAADRATKALRAAAEVQAATTVAGGVSVGDCSSSGAAGEEPPKRRQLPSRAARPKQQPVGSSSRSAPPAAPFAPASEGDKLRRYAAVMCVAKWAETTKSLRGARRAEVEAQAALEAARAHAEEVLAELELEQARPPYMPHTVSQAAGEGELG